MSRSLIGHIFILAVASIAEPIESIAADTAAPLKCCEDGFVFADEFNQCIKVQDHIYEIEYRTILENLEFATNGTRPKTCLHDTKNTYSDENNQTISSNAFASCIDIHENGSLVYLECWNVRGNSSKSQCDSTFTFVEIYGAKMMVFANIIYLFLYGFTLVMYIVMPGICRRAYDKAVLTFFAVQVLISCMIITIGHFMLCHKPLGKLATILCGISLMILTIASCCWLLVISFDVASTITKFRWAPASGAKGRDENHKFRVYLLWVLIGTLVPTSIASLLQFLPISDEFIIKPNFHMMTTVNYRVLVHTCIVPVMIAIASNVLFIYTTVKMINIQKSTSVANENRKASVKKKYILYLKLYLLMDAPYVTGALGSSFEDLWILKFFRIVQPIFLCYAVIPREKLINPFSCKKKKQETKPTELAAGDPA